MSGPGTYDALVIERTAGFPLKSKYSTGEMIVGDGPSFNITGLSIGIDYYVWEAGETDTTSVSQVDIGGTGISDLSVYDNWGCMVHTTDQASYEYATTGSRDDVQTSMINEESYCPSTGTTTTCFCGSGFDEECVALPVSTPTDTSSEGTDIGGLNSGAFKLAMAGVITATLANNFF